MPRGVLKAPPPQENGGREAPRRLGRAPRAALLLVLGLLPAAAGAQVAALVLTDGGAQVAAVDDRLAVVARIAPGATVAGLAAFGAEEQVAYAALRDGRAVRLDLARGEVTAEARVGSEAAGIASSSDGRYLAVAMARPPGLVVLDRALARARDLPGRDAGGKRESAATAVRDDPRRRSFVAALPGLPELWEVSYDDGAPPIYPGLVHDYRLREGIALPGTLNARRVPLEVPVDDLATDPFGADVVAGRRDAAQWQVVNLHVRRRIAWLDVQSGDVRGVARWSDGTRRYVAYASGAELRVADASTWRDAARIPLGGRARIARAHDAVADAWVVVDGDGGRVVLVDKASLRVAGELRPAADAPIVDVGFGRDGRHGFVLLGGPAGALLRYDTRTLVERGRVALADPVAMLAR